MFGCGAASGECSINGLCPNLSWESQDLLLRKMDILAVAGVQIWNRALSLSPKNGKKRLA
jgi:hypothetical protein